jgi:hypothetical protein
MARHLDRRRLISSSCSLIGIAVKLDFSSTHLVACRLLFASSISGLEGGSCGPGEVRDSPGAAGSPSRPAWNTHTVLVLLNAKHYCRHHHHCCYYYYYSPEIAANDILSTPKENPFGGDGCSGAVQGDCLLPSGPDGCYWWEVLTRQRLTTTQTENIKQLIVACSEYCQNSRLNHKLFKDVEYTLTYKNHCLSFVHLS